MPIQSGWANESGTELFTIGWVQELIAAIRAACLPIVGDSWLANCPEQHYTLGWICCDPAVAPIPLGPQPGGGEELALPGYEGNIQRAMREDEEILAMLEAYFGMRRH